MTNTEQDIRTRFAQFTDFTETQVDEILKTFADTFEIDWRMDLVIMSEFDYEAKLETETGDAWREGYSEGIAQASQELKMAQDRIDSL